MNLINDILLFNFCNDIIYDIVIKTILIGIIPSALAAYFYELFRRINDEKKSKVRFKFLESKNDEFDWIHWNIENGKIANTSIAAKKNLKYIKNGEFSFKWKENESSISGEGRMFFEGLAYFGKIFFFEYENNQFNYRNIYYKEIVHLNETYDAIFVNADDFGKKFVLMRKKPSNNSQKTKSGSNPNTTE